jgi:hypothetical protein
MDIFRLLCLRLSSLPSNKMSGCDLDDLGLVCGRGDHMFFLITMPELQRCLSRFYVQLTIHLQPDGSTRIHGSLPSHLLCAFMPCGMCHVFTFKAYVEIHVLPHR